MYAKVNLDMNHEMLSVEEEKVRQMGMVELVIERGWLCGLGACEGGGACEDERRRGGGGATGSEDRPPQILG